MKRTPLKPGKPLRAKTIRGYSASGASTLKPGGPLAKQSAKKRAEIRERAPHNKHLRDNWVDCIGRVEDVCGRYGQYRYQFGTDIHIGRAVDWDERRPRSVGGSATDPANRQDLCRPCHDWKGAHPVKAAGLGLHEFRRGNP